MNPAIDPACAIGTAGTALPVSIPFAPPIDAAWFGWLFGVGIASLVLTIVLLPVIMVRLPADHFVRRHRAKPRSLLGWVGFVGKNALGVVCIVAGVLMLVLPGQGLITLLIGLMLVNFPGKRRLELALVRRPKIRTFLDRMRQKRGKEPFQLDANDAVSASPAASSP